MYSYIIFVAVESKRCLKYWTSVTFNTSNTSELTSMKYQTLYFCSLTSLSLHSSTLPCNTQTNLTVPENSISGEKGVPGMYLQTCTLVPFTICWYQVRQDPFLIPAKERQRLHTSQQKDTVANIPPQAPKDKQGANCKVTAHASTVHLLFVKKKANYPKNYNTNAMKPTVQKASLCCTFMDREECVRFHFQYGFVLGMINKDWVFPSLCLCRHIFQHLFTSYTNYSNSNTVYQKQSKQTNIPHRTKTPHTEQKSPTIIMT